MAANVADSDLRIEIRRLEVFPTLQGGLTSIHDATAGATRTGSFQGEWLTEEAGDERTELDEPIIRVGNDGLRDLLDRLAPIATRDLSREVKTLQLTRRMARGIIAKPTVSSPRELVRDIGILGGSPLGPGEVGLIAGSTSKLIIHQLGEREIEVEYSDISPTVEVAVEAPDRASASADPSHAKHVRELAVKLVDVIAPTLSADSMPEWLRRSLICQMLGGLITNVVAEMPLFQTTENRRRSYSEVCEQAAYFGEVWYVAAGSRGLPLNEKRFVLALSEEEVPAEFSDLITFVQAEDELALDALARENLARPRVTDFILSPGEQRDAFAVQTFAIAGDEDSRTNRSSKTERRPSRRPHRLPRRRLPRRPR